MLKSLQPAVVGLAARAARRAVAAVAVIAVAVVLASAFSSPLWLSGCDRPQPESSSAPQSAPTTQAAATLAERAPARPSTQELLHGEQVRVALKAIPFAVSVPSSWTAKTSAGIMTLEGPTPAGTAQIHISRHVAPIPQHAERLIEGSKREIASSGLKFGLAEVKNLTPEIRCLEYRTVARNPVGGPAIDVAGRSIATTNTPMQWKQTAFLPHGKDTDLCEISFTDLSVEQFELDRELLEKIFASFQYDPQAASN